VKLEKEIEIGQKVIVIGGGNVAIDVARSARRLRWDREGQPEVHVFCLESREEMPATNEEVEAALEEGIFIHYSLGVKRVLSDKGKFAGIETIAVQSVFDQEGRFNPTFIPGSEGLFQGDTIVMAVGQAPDLSFLPADSKLERTKWETLVVNANTLATNIEGIFAGGDFVTGPTHIIEAIAAGRRAAVSIDKSFHKDTSPVIFFDQKESGGPEDLSEKLSTVEEGKPRVKSVLLPPEDRVHDFREIELGFTEEKAKEEAKRCLRCDLSR
jgi:NADH-quinone oxidoreductase subunit F